MNASIHYLIVDQGTSSTKAFLFDSDGQIAHTNRIRHTLLHPAPKHVESDPMNILHACSTLISDALEYVKKSGGRITSIGFAVQRSTFLFWDKETLVPFTPAISWQDTRAWKEAEEFSLYSERIWEITGAPLSSHFGAPKFLHLSDKDSSLKERIENETVWFGPLSAFLTHALTGICSIDESIACRTLLFDIHTSDWSSELLDLFQIPKHCLPPISPTVDNFGVVQFDDTEIPLNCVIGDQQAALIGQGGAEAETLAMNFGTSGSVQLNTGQNVQTTQGLLSSVLFSCKRNRLFMLEGTINACNSLFYQLEKDLNIPHKKMLWHDRCTNTNTEGVFISGVSGLAAPHWKDRFSSIEIGLNDSSNDERIRAGMESIGFLVHDIFSVMRALLTKTSPLITASGGGARPPLLQFVADMIRINIGHTTMKDRTALGVYRLLRYNEEGKFPSVNIECDLVFQPKMTSELQDKKLATWNKALDQIEG